MKHRNKHSNRKKVIFVLALLALAAVGLLLFELLGMGFDGRALTVEIPEGSSTGAVAEILKDADVIESVAGFKLYCRLTRADGTFQYGIHALTSGAYGDVVAALQQPGERESLTVTFPEGYTALNIAQELEKLGLCTVKEFVDACAESYDVEFLSAIPDGPELFIRLEGYLYPDTYKFYIDATPHEMIQIMLENFEDKVYTEDIKEKLRLRGFTLHEALTLASIIQKESFSGEEYNVSSVFNNRLKDGSPVSRLESDTTWYYIYYVLDYYYGGRAPEELRGAYDSYAVEGFIAGPICSPGAHIIDAALSPARTPYYYFLTDNTKKFYYAETVGEHERNIETMKEVNASLEAGA